jgi:Conserved oligomeric complex COG6
MLPTVKYLIHTRHFRACLEDMANIRRNSVTRAFIDALTRGGPGGTPRPIELQAHDPIRYIGDMLAWVHQAAASEREILEGLFDVEGQRGYSTCAEKGKIVDNLYMLFADTSYQNVALAKETSSHLPMDPIIWQWTNILTTPSRDCWVASWMEHADL